ncbi:MAG TPA: chromosome segregation protein SMC [Chthoniobacterales bacterium]|nr:chromosome segregation protein SMC [Chthoniobacterales bacterium]
MHLQSLELFGFKSFADKTIFDFHQGVTAIVGPNGCGKSNVCDAVRWVLGEQSAKSMRGGEMADVIFNGAEARKPLGFAEVSLKFTQCSQELGVDWHDVRVTRRIYRDGNSEYFLNKTLCRLKDIHGLFADTGVGRAAYSIMEQGKIDLILSSRPEDRRSVFEEAAGITKYKTQKKEALRKLEATEANLLRIGDIIKEVKRQIGSLQRQAGKARRYQTLHADLQVLDTHFSHRKLQGLQAELGDCSAEIARISEAEQATRNEINEREAKLAEARRELDLADEKIADGRSKLQQLENEIASYRHRIEFNEKHGLELRQWIERSRREIESAESKLRDQNAEIESANALVEETARLLEQKNDELKQLIENVAREREAFHVSDQKLRDTQISLSKDELRVSAIAEDLRDLRERRDTTKRDSKTAGSRITKAEANHTHLNAQLENARATTEADRQAMEQFYARVRSQEDDLRENQRALADLEKKLATIDRTIAENESRHEVLRELNEEGEGLAQGSQALLKNKEFEFAGALAVQLNVKHDLVPAVEAALGRNLHALILRDAGRAAEIISHLNRHQLGQAALVLEGIEGHDPGPKDLPPTAIDWATNKVQAPESLAPLVRRLLDRVALFKNLEDALIAIRKNPEIAAATLAGEFISHAGILFGGSGKVRTDSLLERKARIEAIATELTKLRREETVIEQQRASLESQIAAATVVLEKAVVSHQEAQFAQAASASKISELEREEYSAARELEALKSDCLTLERQIAMADGQIRNLEEQTAHLEKTITAARRDISLVETQRNKALQEEEDATARLAELRIAAATDEQKHQNLLAQREPMLARQTELTEVVSTRRADIENYEARLVTQAAEDESARNAIEQHTRECRRRQAEIGQLVTDRTSRLENINFDETQLRSARDGLSELQEKRGTHSVRQTQLQLQIEHLAEHVMERYRVDLRAFQPDQPAHEKVLHAQMKRLAKDSVAAVVGRGPDEEAAEQRPATAVTAPPDIENLIADLTRQLENMGPVNLEAVQEYDELEERYRFLDGQNNDLTNSRRELLDVIARINATTKELFAETFSQVRANFREMFAELFGGGRADLQLMDEADALNCGIEIIAKPPGKQLQSISLLSGGERTMTAVALLFAIYMVRPSPFCVLDEMDAPLDESNINRFIKVLERFVSQSQFIIITHNKRTIAKADILYGVTMEERGVSKLVGMKLTPPKRASTNGARATVEQATQRHFSVTEENPRIGTVAAR